MDDFCLGKLLCRMKKYLYSMKNNFFSAETKKNFYSLGKRLKQHKNEKETEDDKNDEAAAKIPDVPDNTNEEEYDKFDDNIHYLNKKYRPFRDQNEDDEKGSDEEDSSDNYSCTTTTSTIMDPQQVRSKVRKSLLKKIKQEKRRIRNKGESSLLTQKNRENIDTIKASLDFD